MRDKAAKAAKPSYRTNEFVRDAFEIKITPFLLDTFAQSSTSKFVPPTHIVVKSKPFVLSTETSHRG